MRADLGDLATERTPDPLLGRIIADRYRIVGPVGRGGMGVVYQVEHLRIGKMMAMKLLTGELSRNREIVRRFKREALAASRLTSINTVQVWDFGHSDGLTYLVMELVHGDDLGKVLRTVGTMPFQRVARIAVQACNSLVEANTRGIVHRDLKPENLILLHTEGNELQDLVKVLDFGLAKVHEDERTGADITTTGAIVGTPFYMSPEQIRGEQVDGRADIYALGAVMYRAITGSPPFAAPTPMGVLTQHLTEPLIPPHLRAPELRIPEDGSQIVVRAMSKSAEDRYQSATELRETLIDYLATEGGSGGFLRSTALDVGRHSAPGADLGRLTATTPVGASLSPASILAPRARSLAVRALPWAVAALAVGVATGAVTYPRSKPMRPTASEEGEPNNDIAHARPLVLGAPVSGFIGKRLGSDQGDVDVYSFDAPPVDGERPLLEIDLSALPNMPLCLELLRSEREPPLGTFCRARGEGLHVGAFAVEPGRYYLRVTQDRWTPTAGERAPVYENVSDRYSLRLALAVRSPAIEIEPNDSVSTAQALSPSERVSGAVGWRGDRDVYCAPPASGAASIVVTGHGAAVGLPPVLVVEALRGDGAARTIAVSRDRPGVFRIPVGPAGNTWCGSIRENEQEPPGPPRTSDGRGYEVTLERP